MATSFVSSNLLLAQTMGSVAGIALLLLLIVPGLLLIAAWLCVRYIPNNSVGVVEKALVGGGFGTGGSDYRARWRGGLPI